ncbi:hypothetical protein [Nocardia sp. NRRL S-836]|uniref:hypothetical protein n=1 Tax=Nocardia sp. NRRL S-836 TaxID=1519492 RepID=UPI0006AE4E82|nr:hypothetical protein [Nocardia sp. NRRL S-836]KOV87183.1 hypothetical protein ADL03_07395 [Nocardia sp. NRRL S-836]
MTGRTRTVRCRTVWGVLIEVEIEDLNEFVTPAAVLEQRLVRVNGGTYVYKYVSQAEGKRDPRRYDLLDNEIRAGTRLGQSFGAYPAELACLMAYNIDAVEPFVLLREYIGVPLAGPAARFTDAERRQCERALFRALHLTSQAGVVHGAVTADALRWDNGRVQLVDFESAERVGEARRAGRVAANRSPEQLAGTGLVDAHDDVWGAAVLIRRLHLGPSADAQADRRHDPERLRGLLDPVFGNAAEHRPTPAELLSRLHGDNHLPPYDDPYAVFARGREMFQFVGRGKNGGAAVSTEDPKPVRKRRMFPFLSALLLVSATIVMTAVLG